VDIFSLNDFRDLTPQNVEVLLDYFGGSRLWGEATRDERITFEFLYRNGGRGALGWRDYRDWAMKVRSVFDIRLNIGEESLICRFGKKISRAQKDLESYFRSDEAYNYSISITRVRKGLYCLIMEPKEVFTKYFKEVFRERERVPLCPSTLDQIDKWRIGNGYTKKEDLESIDERYSGKDTRFVGREDESVISHPKP
jgi:hypothetical protein